MVAKLTYYERWIVAFACILLRKEILTPTEIALEIKEVEGKRHHRRRQRGRVDLQAFDRRQRGNGRRDRAVAIEQGGADQADDQQMGAPGAGRRVARREQRHSATMPPSPRLSARRISMAYLTEMMRISAHRISETVSSAAVWLSGTPWAAAFAAASFKV
ncbi:hypothetical protein ACVWY2_003348 [Bradyrhizobium sp. JR6.1]